MLVTIASSPIASGFTINPFSLDGRVVHVGAIKQIAVLFDLRTIRREAAEAICSLNNTGRRLLQSSCIPAKQWQLSNNVRENVGLQLCFGSLHLHTSASNFDVCDAAPTESFALTSRSSLTLSWMPVAENFEKP